MIRRTVLDRRGGRRETWVLLPKGVKRLMRVPEVMRRCVAFLYCLNAEGEEIVLGTCFFIAYPVPDHEARPLYVTLTAQHVIVEGKKHAADGKIRMRLNGRSGNALWYEADADEWLQVADGIDCALLPWNPGAAGLDAEWAGWGVVSKGIATTDVQEAEGIGIGDEVFMVGLFRNHTGRDRNEPIVRVGNIAAIPADPVATKHFGRIPAYLIEARSIGGISGSPVFVHLGYTRWRDGQIMHWKPGNEDSPRPFSLLGLIHGHWDADDSTIDLGRDPATKNVNVGIAIVVPIDEIMRTVGPLLERMAEALRVHYDSETVPTPDSIESSDHNDLTEFERFEGLAKKLINTPKPKNQDPDESGS